MSSQFNELARYGISQKLMSDASNETMVAQQSVGSASLTTNPVLALLLLLVMTLVNVILAVAWI